jgi:hypothetical protein
MIRFFGLSLADGTVWCGAAQKHLTRVGHPADKEISLSR